MSLEEKIVTAVLRNLNDRSGFDHWWDGMDDEIQDEVRESLQQDVRRALGWS